jgi:Uncharacterized protein conserved in bacteria (DUF2125)
MKNRVGLLFAIPFLMSVSTAALAAATGEEAQRLTMLFQSYLSAEPGVVTVKTDGDGYLATFDFAPFAKKASDSGVTLSMTPIVLSVKDKTGGKWDVSQDGSMEYIMKAGDAVSANVKAASYKWSGVFDENLATFEIATGQVTDMIVIENINDPTKGKTELKVAVKEFNIAQSATASANGGDDVNLKYDIKGFTETIAAPGDPAANIPPMNLVVTAETALYDVNAKGIKPKPIFDILAFFISHQSKELIIKDQAALKTMLTDGLPLFQNMNGKGTLNKVSVATPIGPVAFDSLSVEVDANGITKDGKFRESISFTGIVPPPAIIPPWATQLVPKNVAFDFQGTGFDLESPAQLILAALDLSKDPPLPEGFENTLLPSALPKGTADITLNPTSISNDVYAVNASGTLTVGPAGLPSGKGTIKAKGLDEVLKVIQSAPPEMGLQGGVAMIVGFKGMGKAEADGTVTWNIESAGDGKVLINGLDISQMK